MDSLIRNDTKNSPYIYLDQEKGLIEIKGSSLMEDVRAFYDPILEWIYEYIDHPKVTKVNMDLGFYNLGSAKIYLIILKVLSKIEKTGFRLTINWYYDENDEKSIDSCLDFSILSNLKFNLIKRINNLTIEQLEKCNE